MQVFRRLAFRKEEPGLKPGSSMPLVALEANTRPANLVQRRPVDGTVVAFAPGAVVPCIIGGLVPAVPVPAGPTAPDPPVTVGAFSPDGLRCVCCGWVFAPGVVCVDRGMLVLPIDDDAPPLVVPDPPVAPIAAPPVVPDPVVLVVVCFLVDLFVLFAVPEPLVPEVVAARPVEGTVVALAPGAVVPCIIGGFVPAVPVPAGPTAPEPPVTVGAFSPDGLRCVCCGWVFAPGVVCVDAGMFVLPIDDGAPPLLV